MVREFDAHSDYIKVKDILGHSFNSDILLNRNINSFSNKKTIYVLESNGKLVATATLVIVDKFIYGGRSMALIEDIATVSKTSTKTVVTRLINELIEKAKLYDCYKVIVDYNDNLESFYEMKGFKRDGDLMRIDL